MLKQEKAKTKSGSALIFAIIVLFAILTVMIVLSTVTVMEQKMSQKTKSSTGAFFNAESGTEWALNKIASSSGTIASNFTLNPDSSIDCPFSGSLCKIYLLGTDGKVITNSGTNLSEVKAVRSVGTQYVGGTPDTSRSIEAAVAAEDVPSGAVMFFNLATCPSGWTELTAARGRYIVGLPASGTLTGTAGTQLTDLENRPVGRHRHTINVATSDGTASRNNSPGTSYTTITPGITAYEGTVDGTNAPYIQLLACAKN